MAHFVGLLMFLVFVEDSSCAYATHLAAPMGWVRPLLLDPTPIKIRAFDLLSVFVLILASWRGPRPAPGVTSMRNAILLAIGTTVAWFAYGMSRGGEGRFASWQTYGIFSMLVLAFTVSAVCRTVADFHRLAKWLVAASIYRASFCWISYFTWARGVVGASGAFLTQHDDTIIWVASIFVLIVNMLDRRSPLVTARNVAGILFFLGALQFNSRRLAWVSLAMGLVVMYFLFPEGATKRRLTRMARVGLVAVVAYVIVGWGRTERIFLPLRSFSTVTTHEDGSTLARNAENLGLIATANWSSFLFGTGWGKPYVYLTMKYDISGFELWRYIPHNSILGLLAFTGVLGFAGFWLAVPTAVFLNARVARLARDAKARSVGIVGAAQLIVCANQFYGDMGIFFTKALYVIGVSYAIALRMPVLAGVWGQRSTRARVPSPSPAAVSGAAAGVAPAPSRAARAATPAGAGAGPPAAARARSR